MRKFFAVLASIAVVAMAAPAMAATNPFMDVPQGHWAYDAVALLASRGVVSGYPDGAFKGAQPATRYEMASVVARALTTIDAEKASKQDLELLKKLVMEFKDELDALGVKVDKIDKRVAVLEDNIGGWKIRGLFWFDASFAGGDNDKAYIENGKNTEFNKQRFRLNLTKQIDENTSFYAQVRMGENEKGGGNGMGDMSYGRIRDIYVTTKLPYDTTLRFGRLLTDVEGDYGFYLENDAIFTDFRYDGFELTKKWNTVSAMAFVGRNSNREHSEYADTAEAGSFMAYGLNVAWQPNEKFFGGLSGYWFADDNTPGDGSWGFNTYGIYAGYKFNDAVELKGLYYFQDLDSDLANALGGVGAEDSPKAWKAVLTFDQSLLKFTSLRFEYAQTDNMFFGTRNYYGIGEDTGYGAMPMDNMPWNNNTTKTFQVRADQKWNDKWSSFIRYTQADFDTTGLDDTKNWGVAVKYQYTPAIAFRLLYDNIDFGDNNVSGNSGTDHVVQFRTTVSF